jgi:hypothetical protein
MLYRELISGYSADARRRWGRMLISGSGVTHWSSAPAEVASYFRPSSLSGDKELAAPVAVDQDSRDSSRFPSQSSRGSALASSLSATAAS